MFGLFAIKGFTDFLKFMYPGLMALHRYLYRERDPDGSGLVYIRHPWESGLDNSPAWDKPLKKIRVDRKEIPNFFSKLSYQIGDFSFLPEAMEHGILRANTRPPYKIFPVFGRKDPRLGLSLKKMNPRIHFALALRSGKLGA